MNHTRINEILDYRQALARLKRTQGQYGAGGWIRTIEACASDLQSDPFGHSGTPAENRRHFPAQTSNCQSIFSINSHSYVKKHTPNWSWREESNPRPADYKSAALPTELRQLFDHRRLWRRNSIERFMEKQHLNNNFVSFRALFAFLLTPPTQKRLFCQQNHSQ